ncbi:hypothetical protein CapIbe_021624 [Capra ibex]
MTEPGLELHWPLGFLAWNRLCDLGISLLTIQLLWKSISCLLKPACGFLVPQPRIEPVPATVKAQKLNHWATRGLAVSSHHLESSSTHLLPCPHPRPTPPPRHKTKKTSRTR